MAEFINVMKDFNRMCEYGKRHPVAGYCGAHCPVEIACGFEKPNSALHVAMNEPEKFERAVMHWAAEHPEPVYPTWEEWLVNQGVFERFACRYGIEYQYRLNGRVLENIPTEKLFEHIPADIAQMLGLKPKEG